MITFCKKSKVKSKTWDIILFKEGEVSEMKAKRILSIVMAAVMTVGLFPSVDASAAENSLAELTLPYTAKGYKIAGNITLPETLADGVTEIDWSSSNETVINTEKQEFTAAQKQEYGERYEEIPAGVVTRQAQDTPVTLTAKVGNDVKNFQVTVKARPKKNAEQMYEDGDFTGYLYASFVEPEVSAYRQQVYFASSNDGVHWDDLNRNMPVLESKLGTKATRDHYILRAPEGDRFYLIATDLDCTSGKWGEFSSNGSKYLMIWESDDLVNWSKQRMVKIADDMTGCAWAPETIYDEVTGEYIVYWSGQDLHPGSDSYNKKVVYVSRTRDFYSFSEQQEFVYSNATDGTVHGTSSSYIDTTMIKGSDGLYYRVTKFEDMPKQWNCGTKVFMDVAKYPMGEYTRVETNLSEDAFDGVEGPGWFRYNKDDAERTGYKYCLMLDGYNGKNAGVGFFPTAIADLNTGTEGKANFTKLEGAKMRTWAKHGGIMPLTQEEYARVNEAYKYAPEIDLSPYTSEARKVFDATEYYTTANNLTGLEGAGWKLPSGTSFDDDTRKYLGFEGSLSMGNGYGKGKDWVAVQFLMAGNSAGDAVIKDTSGKNIFGYCYANTGFWAGHGERGFGGTIIDKYGIKRLSSYEGTEVGAGSEADNTGQGTNKQGDLCTLLFQNGENGYTVSLYVGGKHVSTERYSGSFDGIGAIETLGRQYYGSLKLFASETGDMQQEEPVKPPVNAPALTDDADLLMHVTFDEADTGTGTFNAAKGGTVTEHGNVAYVDGANGTKALSIAENAAGNYLELPEGILSGRKAATFTFQLKTSYTKDANWVFMTTPLSDSKQEYMKEKYLGVGGVKEGQIEAERHNLSERKGILRAEDDFSRWRNVAVVYEPGSTKVYVDGERINSDTYQIDIGELMTENAATWIGHANWADGEGFSGMIDDFRIYGRSLRADEIAAIAKGNEVLSADSGRLLMETTYTQNGRQVWSVPAQGQVKVRTKVTNYSKGSRKLAYYITGHAANGNITEKVQQAGETVTVKSLGTTVFSRDIAAKPGTAYYALTVKDITDAGRTQEFDAGLLPTGNTMNAQMAAGTYQVQDGTQAVISVSDVKGTQVTVGGRTLTAVLENGAVLLKDGGTVFATKTSASISGGELAAAAQAEPVVLPKSSGGNPVLHTDKDGNRIYGGDPAAVVIGDEVYLIIGHDNGHKGNNNENFYKMPDWQYYTSTDMKTWTHKGQFMNQADIPWKSQNDAAWASQMTPYTNKETGETKYYFYFCTPYEGGRHGIGVAVADNPGGPYTATSAPLVKGKDTWAEGIGDAGHHDIDPTVWIETDEKGDEHRYLMWGNTTCFLAELNEDMVSIKDVNGDGQITIDHTGSDDHDIKYIKFENTLPGQGFTEAPWLYRRQDANGNYYGKYYMFAAWGWAEKMGYATADNPWGPWTFQEIIMENTLTSNTNHPAVIDFQGKTYFIYHNGALPGGNGGNRSVCIQELTFREDGSIAMMEDMSLGLGGTASEIRTFDNRFLGHVALGNTQGFVVGADGGLGQGEYKMDVKGFAKEDGYNTQWEIVPARYVPKGENSDHYVSIQSANITGYFIKTEAAQTKLASDNMDTMGAMMSYKTVKALDGSNGVSFESVAFPGRYLAFMGGKLVTAKPVSLAACSFAVSEPGTGAVNQDAADKVIALINKIGSVGFNSDSKAAIDAARKAYNALSDEQKKLVPPEFLKKLTDAEGSYTRLEQEKKQKDEEERRKKEEEAKKKAQAGTVAISKTQKDITTANTDKGDVKGSTFAALKAKAAGGNKSVTISWSKVKGASGYMVYGSLCGKKMKLLKTLPSSKKSYKAAKLKKGTYYKYMVVAYKVIYKEKRTIAASVTVHACTNGGKYANPSSISYRKSKVTLKKGKTLTLKPKYKSKKKVKTHIAKFRYESSNPKIATVSKTGKIKGKKKGSCYIYLYTQNGINKRVKVTVK